MDNEQIEEVINEICQRFSDSRVHYCRLSLAAGAAGRPKVTGTVLDEETKSAVIDELNARLPAGQVDVAELQVLRQARPKHMVVGTNLAGYHHRPSRTSEMVSQNVCGETLEYLREEDGWVFARQRDGYLGWTYKPYLTSDIAREEPAHILSDPVTYLRTSAGDNQQLVSRLFAGTAVQVLDKADNWSRIKAAGELSGWVPTSALRSLDKLPAGETEQRQQMILDSKHYLGVPYRWGGCTVHGIDCSGYAQLLHKLSGITIPRDADMQFAAAAPVEPPFQAGDLLYFGSQTGKRSITHVGLSLGGWRIIHSSGPRNGVYEDDVQKVSWLSNRFRGANTFMKN